MDYKYGIYFKGLIIITAVNLCKTEIEREILLTPQHSLQVNGKILYFKPIKNITCELNENIPWEQALKHVTFLTLNNHLNDATDLSDLPEYKKFMNATYIQNDLYIPKFGDIITLAKGRLESDFTNSNIKFIEGLCNEKCDPKHTLAFWQVEKIRQRDSNKKFRYEIRLTINTKDNNNEYNEDDRELDSKIDSSQSESRNSEVKYERYEIEKNNYVKRSQRTPRILRSFILKDNDYPSSFSFLDDHLIKRHNSATRAAYLDKLNAFNDVFTQARYFSTNKIATEHDFSKLNIGEYFIPTRTTHSTKDNNGFQGQIGTFKSLGTTTYRPTFDQKFSVANNFPYTYHYENSGISRRPLITSIPVEYDGFTNGKIKVHPQQSFDSLKTSINRHSNHRYYDSNFANKNIPRKEYFSSEIASPQPYIPNTQSTIRLIERPLNQPAEPFNYGYRTSPTISNQIPIPPSQSPTHYSLDTTYPGTPPPPALYNPTRGLSFKNLYDKDDYKKSNEDLFSSTDSLYRPGSFSNIHEGSSRSNQSENFNFENSFELQKSPHKIKPDSINAQLPPPLKGQDINVPYVDKIGKTTETSMSSQLSTFGKKQAKIVTKSPQSNKKTLTTPEQTTLLPVTPTKMIRSRTTAKRSGKISKQTHDVINTATSTVKIDSVRPRHKIHRSTTERPVLKWKAKRGKITREYPTSKTRKHGSTPAKYEFEKVYVDQKVATVTPSKPIEDMSNIKLKNIATKKSIATSITYKVGKDKLQKPFKPTIKIPNVEIVEANLVKLPTPNNNEIKLFKATENLNEKLNKSSKEESELTETIVNHARNL
ncbi:uncharacterized protein LOC129617455 [Condylostylus longicornis]|uniref:uncharacterized protein LOC129617455 n=1 Tax=Condylostylus longicornis TaxID=2530218 RepID=UPI00244DE5E7|nr:uncharacterized protein LOC129617455 [Condylostylus longicornis]